MRNFVIAISLTASAAVAGPDIAAADQRCVYRQERVCRTIGRGHDGTPRVACSYRTVRQCFQVPEVRNRNLRFRRTRRK